MERLTKRSNKTVHENGVCCTHFMGLECSERDGECTDNCPWEEAAWSKLADYEDAEEQGLLLWLPCKVGTTAYIIVDDCNFGTDCYAKRTCRGCEYRDLHIEPIVFGTESSIVLQMDTFGERIFLTREEAEAALAEKGGAE